MMTTTQANVYPGMLNSEVEFFKSEDGIKIITNGTIQAFNQISTATYQLLKEALHADLPALNVLSQWYPKSELCQLEKFTECRLGGLDHTPDISNGILQDGEYWECPYRGQCMGEGKVCKSLKFKGEELSSQEIELMKLLCSTATNEVIAEQLVISLGLFHKIKQKLYAKLGVQTKQEVAQIAMSLNLIKTISATA
jgi:DNA-binding CsgD family transcriptional regulator